MPSKHPATSLGIGATAGIVMRNGKSPVGFVSVKTIVLEFGVLTPEMDFASPLPYAWRPWMTLK